MAYHRCNRTLIIGTDTDRDLVYQEGRAYDDGDENVRAALARFPEHFDSPDPQTVSLQVQGKEIGRVTKAAK